MRLHLIGVALIAGALAACATDAKGVGGFDFNTYEFAPTDAYGEIDNDAAQAQAQAFLARRHPRGSPLEAAVLDVRNAGAACRPVAMAEATHIRCTYARPGHGLAGLVGSSVWRIDLYAQGGRMTQLSVKRELDAT